MNNGNDEYPRKRLSFRVEENLSHLLDDVSRQKGIKKSDIVRLLLEVGLQKYTEDPDYPLNRTRETLTEVYKNSELAYEIDTFINIVSKLKKNHRQEQINLSERMKPLQKKMRDLEHSMRMWDYK